MDFLTHNDLLWLWFRSPVGVFQSWVGTMAMDMDFDWADGPLDAPIHL